MKTLLAIREQEYAWANKAFPSVHPLLLPLCNKPFVEFIIDFATLTGSSGLRIVSDASLAAVERYCDDGSRWGITISYGSLQELDDQKTLLNKNRRFCQNDRIMIISGFHFIRYDKRTDYAKLVQSLPDGVWATCPGGTITLAGATIITGTEASVTPIPLVPIDSLASFCKESMETLENGTDRFVLPGYGGEPGCAIGRNVVISKSVEIRKPVSIGNNVQLASGSVIGPSAIIGSNVIIDRESTISNSIVLDNTYVGEHLEVTGRIASGNLLTEPTSGASIAMEDPHLLSAIKRGSSLKSLPRKIVHAIAAAMLIMLLALPYLLLRTLLALTGRWRSIPGEYLSRTPGQNLKLKKVELSPTGALATIACALSLDRFTRLFSVMTGHLSLIGSTPIEADSSTERPHNGVSCCRPAVFSYAEAEEWPASGADESIVERYHLAHSTPVRDIGLTFKAFINRLQEKSTS